ncbi:hypothetical protein PsorP6_016326 [Peronosclerospora sorghi]|uniref:Uncharacterized protein n=1 Tax=Peronosclerospora sorghi TaxID=230839 RepID=A0ACC0VLW3_9STRA|nr:hypothetical protein PsorP6_016326 [Peronosclerospora sorghi]
MCKVIRPLAIAAVLLSATSSTLSITVFSEGSEIVIRDGEESSPPEAEGRRMLRGKDEANQEAQEETVGPPIARVAFEASSSEALHMFGDPDAVLLQNLRSYYKEFFFQGHPVAYSYCVKLGVNLDDVPTSFAKLVKRLPEGSTIGNDKLFLMAIGNEYFKAEQLLNPPSTPDYAPLMVITYSVTTWTRNSLKHGKIS